MNARNWGKAVYGMLSEAIATMNNIPGMDTIKFQTEFKRNLIKDIYADLDLLETYDEHRKTREGSFRDTLTNKQLKAISDMELKYAQTLVRFLPHAQGITEPFVLIDFLKEAKR